MSSRLASLAPASSRDQNAGTGSAARKADAAGQASGLLHRDDAVAGHVHDADRRPDSGEQQTPESVILVDQLQPGVKPQRDRDHWQAQVVREAGAQPRTDDIGQPQHGDLDVGAATRESPDIALDLNRVLAKTGAG